MQHGFHINCSNKVNVLNEFLETLELILGILFAISPSSGSLLKTEIKEKIIGKE